jgi:putative acetyltransferase
MLEINEVKETRRVSRKLVRELGFLRPGAAIADIPFAQCHTLIELEERGTLTVGDLADILKVDKSAVSRTVNQMLKEKLVSIVPDKADPRRRPITLSPTGRVHLKKIHDQTNKEVSQALSLLSLDERKKVIEGMTLYADAIAKTNLQQGFSIRAIVKADNPAIADIIRKVMPEFGANKAGFAIHDPEVDDMYSTYATKDAAYFVIEKDGEVLGGAGVAPLLGGDPGVCELRKMYFLSQTRGRGLGKKLLATCLEKAKKLGFTHCYLETLERMHQAQGLYRSFGFTPLKKPLGKTGHFGCDSWYMLEI